MLWQILGLKNSLITCTIGEKIFGCEVDVSHLRLAGYNVWHNLTCEKFNFFMVRESQLGDSSKVVKILEFKAGVSQWVTRWKSVHCLDMRRWSLMGSLQKVIRETIWRQMVPGLCSFWVCGDGAWEPSKKIAVKQSEDRWSLANPATSQPQSLLEIRKNT